MGIKQKQHIRSVSLPCRSHPSTVRIEEELNKIKALEPSSVCNGVSGLDDLYLCLDDLLNLATTQQALSQHHRESWFNELLDGPMKMLDICGTTRDFVSEIKENVRDLRSSLRRRKTDSSLEIGIAKSRSFGKKMKKEAKRLVAALKQTDNQHCSSSPLLDLDLHLSAVVRALREVNATSSSTFQSLLFFLSSPISKPKPSRWSLVSKLIHKGAVSSEEQSDKPNEMEIVDVALIDLCRHGSGEIKKIQTVQNRLEALEKMVEEIENGLECLFRRLIRTRASLLNIASH